ncbi:Lactose permease [Lachnellula suecica]|uniref:Lactose permease n=1 Tax=Lachnellula suecica TaxID=602035 RepID=A0A8T9C8A5_9HELO|nr:Lactose permease [Lachnellula suecica]
MGLLNYVDGTSDPILTNMVAEDKVAWYKKTNLRALYFLLLPACIGIEITSGFDAQLINALQFIPPFNEYFGNGFINPNTQAYDITPTTLGLIKYTIPTFSYIKKTSMNTILHAAYSLGAVIAVPFAPTINQWVGRRYAIMCGSVLMLSGAVLQGFSLNVAMYVISRMLLGFGVVFCIISGSAMVGELAHPKERAIMTSLFNSSYYVGAIVAAVIGLRTATIKSEWSWRIPSFLQCIPSLIQIIFVFFLPESPRYLVSKDREKEAFEILTKYHAEGNRNSVFVRAEMAQIRETIKIEMEYAKQSWADMVKTPGMRRRVLIASLMGLFTQLSGNTLLSYYMNKILGIMSFTKTSVSTRINVSWQCWGWINGTLAALLVTRFPRRKMFLLSTTSMLCVFIALTIAIENMAKTHAEKRKNTAASVAGLFFIYAYNPCYNIGNNALTYTYLVELFPYAERARGIAVEQFFGRMANFFSTYVNAIAIDAISWRYLAIYCGVLTCEVLCVYFLYPETQGRTLEELAFMFEDKSFAETVVTAVEKQIYIDRTGIYPTDENAEPPDPTKGARFYEEKKRVIEDWRDLN